MNKVWAVYIGVGATGGKRITVRNDGIEETVLNDADVDLTIALEMALNRLRNHGERVLSVIRETGHATLDSIFLVVTEPLEQKPVRRYPGNIED